MTVSQPQSAVQRVIDIFADTAAILISIVSNSYYGMPRGQIHINLPPEHPIMSFETIEIKMTAVSRLQKRSIMGISNPLSRRRDNYSSLSQIVVFHGTVYKIGEQTP